MLRDFALPAIILASLIAGVLLQPQFFDPYSLLITCGGALTITTLSYTRDQLRTLLLAIADLSAAKTATVQEHIEQLRRLTELYRLEGLRGLESQEPHLSDRYLRYGLELLLDLSKEEKIRLRMEQRLLTLQAEAEINRQILTTLGRLLPSFGLIGTLIGMVLLLSRITPAGHNGLTAALSLSMLTTLYGAIFANVIVAPLLARLQSAAVENAGVMNLTKDWILMIARGEPAAVGANNRASLPDLRSDRFPLWDLIGATQR